MLRRLGIFLSAGLLLLPLVGCGSGYSVTGQFVKSGQPIAIDEKETFTASLQQVDGDKKAFPVSVDRGTGNFKANNVPAGKYKILVTWMGNMDEFFKSGGGTKGGPGGPTGPPGSGPIFPKGSPGGPTGGPPVKGPPDRLKGAYGPTSPLEVEISGAATLKVDLDTKQVSK